MTATKPRRVKRRKPRETLLIRTSERSAFQTCLHQWQWSYIDKRRPRYEGPALRFGTLIHKALEKRYPPGIRRGPHPAKTFEKLYEEATQEAYSQFGFTDEDGKWQEAGELGVDMMEHWVEHYGKDDVWEVLSAEQTFQVPVFDPLTNRYLFTYVGTIDAVWRHRAEDRVRLRDYKTTSKDPTQEARNTGYTGHLSLQAGAYWTWGVDWLIEQRILKPRHIKQLDGMTFDYIRKAKRDERPKNKDGYSLNQDGSISKQQPPPYFHRETVYRSAEERQMIRARAIRQVKRMIELRNGPAQERIKEPHWLNCRMCPFKDPCEVHEMGSDWRAVLEGSTESWEPYEAHEVEAEEVK